MIEGVLRRGFAGTTVRVAAMVLSLAVSAGFEQGLVAQKLTLQRNDAQILIEPYAPNVVRVSISKMKEYADAAPGYGITAQAGGDGWKVESGSGGDVLRSSRMVVTVAPQGPKWVPTGTAADIAQFFGGSTGGVGLSITMPDGTPLLRMHGWEMSVPNHKDGDAGVLYDRREGDHPYFRVGGDVWLACG